MTRQEQAIELYRAKHSIYEIARLLGCAPQTVSKWLTKAGEPRRSKAEGTQIAFEKSGRGRETRLRREQIKQRKAQLKTEKEHAVILYLSGQSAASIGREIGRPTKTITQWVKEAGYTLRPLTVACRKHTLREDAFSKIETDAQAYWLGFITADGGISDRDELRINLQLRDKHHLEQLREFLGASYEVGEAHIERFTKGMPYVRHSAYFDALSHLLCADLRRHGIGPRKSETVQFNQGLPDQLYSAYLRGLFDGDGGWCSLTSRTNAQWRLCGNAEFLVDVEQFLARTLALDRRNLTDHHKTCWLKYLIYCDALVTIKIAAWMYSGATIWLERKYAAFQQYLRQYHPELNPDLIGQRNS